MSMIETISDVKNSFLSRREIGQYGFLLSKTLIDQSLT